MIFKFVVLFMILLQTDKNACSEEMERAILEGTRARLGQFPYVVFISSTPVTAIKNFWGSDCTGTILTKLWVVTAAHCYTEYAKYNTTLSDVSSRVQAGTIDNKYDTSTTQTRTSRHYVMMDKDPKSEMYDLFNNDVLILKVTEPFLFNHNVGPTTIAKRPLPEGKQLICTVVGFGAAGDEREKTKFFNTKLYYTNVSIDGDKFSCRKRAQKRRDFNAEYYGEEHICVDPVNYRSSPCNGDSGGPVVCDGLDVGVSSGRLNIWEYFARCGRKGNYHVYAFLGFHEKWLRKYIQELPPFKLVYDRSDIRNEVSHTKPLNKQELVPKPKPNTMGEDSSSCHDARFRVADVTLVVFIECILFHLHSSILVSSAYFRF